VLILSQATHGRRVKAQSGSASDEPVYHRGEHLALQTAQGRAFAHMQVVVGPANGKADIEVLGQDLGYAGDRSSIPTFFHPDQRLAQPSGSLGV
jgi:hypothetical protein